MKQIQRIISIIMVICLTVTAIPQQAFAAEEVIAEEMVEEVIDDVSAGADLEIPLPTESLPEETAVPEPSEETVPEPSEEAAETLPSDDGTPTEPPLTVFATVKAEANVRKEPSQYASVVGVMEAGTTVLVLETTTANNKQWARIESGWVLVDYLILDYGPDVPEISPEQVSGTCGKDMSWTLSNEGVLTISGTGSMDSYDINAEYAPWYTYADVIKSAEIGDGVVSIGAFAFHGLENLKSITLPDTLESIEAYAFEMCVSLEEINIPDSLEMIGSYAFSHCISLTEIVIPEMTEELDPFAFDCCKNLENITVSEDNLWYTSQDGVLYDKEMKTLVRYPHKKTGAVSVPDSVECIGEFAFTNCSDVTEITVPGTVKTISAYAFFDCFELKSVTLEEGVEYVGKAAFMNCQWITEMVFPDSVTDIEVGALYGTGVKTVRLPAGLKVLASDLFSFTPLETLELPQGLECIESCAFDNCALTSLVLPETLTRIDNDAFCRSAVQTLDYPDSLTSFGDSVFRYSKVESVFLPGFLTEIPNTTYEGCSNLETAVIPEHITRIGTGAFNLCYNLKEVTIPGSVSAIGSSAFANVGSGCEFVFEGDAPDFDSDTFRNSTVTCYYPRGNDTWSSDVLLDYGGTVTWIPKGEICTGGHTVVTDKAVEATCTESGLTEGTHCSVCGEVLVAQEGIAPKGHTEVVMEKIDATCTESGLTGGIRCSVCNLVLEPQIKIPATGIHSYVDTVCEFCGIIGGTCGDNLNWQLDDKGVLTISGTGPMKNYSLFISAPWYKHKSSIKSIVLEEGITSISSYAFNGCSAVTGELVLPESLTSVGTNAFNQMSGVRKLVFRGKTDLNSNIISSGMSGLSGLEEMYVLSQYYSYYAPMTMSILGSSDKIRLKLLDSDAEYLIEGSAFVAYFGDDSEFVIPEGITSIQSIAFRNCKNLTRITIPDSVTSIGSYAFARCSALTTLELPDSLRNIDDHAFFRCSGMKGTLQLPEGLVSIGGQTFGDCSGLSGTLQIPETVQVIDYSAFAGCSGFTGDLIIPDSVTTIGSAAFKDCSGFTGTLSISDNVTSIPSGAFDGMSGITSIVFGEKLQSIDGGSSTHPFGRMTKVQDITFRGLQVPALPEDAVSPFRDMTGLKTIHVPLESYDAYVEAFAGMVDSGVKFVTAVMDMPVIGLTASPVYSKTVCLSWEPHADSGVVGYKIFRDGVQICTSAECSFTDRDLVPEQTYTYQVCGYTANDINSAMGEIQATPRALRIREISTNDPQGRVGVNNTVQIHVYDDGNLMPYEEAETTAALYYRLEDQEYLIGEATRENPEDTVFAAHWDVSEMENGTYTLIGRVTDIDGTTSEISRDVQVDSRIPGAIENVAAVGTLKDISLSWSVSKEADTNVYIVYRRVPGESEFSKIAQINDRMTLHYADTAVEKEIMYEYCIAGVDDFGQEGERSAVVSAELMTDEEAPQVTKLTPVNASYLSGKVRIGLKAEDNMAVAGAKLYYSLDQKETWTLLAELESADTTAELDTTALADGTIHIKGIAYDLAGNESSPLTYVYAIDNTGPEQVQGLDYVSTDVTVTLRWSGVADEDVRYYCVERKNAEGSYTKISDVSNTLGINLYELAPQTEYIYRVTAYDAQGNAGIPSEDISVLTLADEVSPVIAQMGPGAGWYCDEIPLSVEARDEYTVDNIRIQISTDILVWEDIYTQSYTDISKKRTLSWKLPLDAYPEGSLYVRAVAEDKAGNESESGVNAPYVQYIVDRTAPGIPQNVKAEGNSGYVEVSWTQGSETDLAAYTVSRGQTAEGPFEQVSSSVTATNFIDRNVEEGLTYYYKVSVRDRAGNESEASAVVSAQIIPDTQKPEIISVYPESGTTLGRGMCTVSALATDNRALGKVMLEYSLNDGTYQLLEESTDLNDYSATVSAQIPLEGVSDSTTVSLRVTAEDAAGNAAEPVEYHYSVDMTAPQVESVMTNYGDRKLSIIWTGKMEEDLAGYRVYRKEGENGTYHLIAQRKAVDGQRRYECSDADIPLKAVTCYYKIEAVDMVGNTDSMVVTEEYTGAVIHDISAPVPVIECEPVQQVGVEYIIDASSSWDNTGIVSYNFDFGDGTTSTAIRPTHIYEQVGEYTITLTVQDEEGNTATVSRMIEVKDYSQVGTARIRIVDEEGVPVTGAPVYFDLGRSHQVIRYTDSSGCAVFTGNIGKHTVGCVIPNNEWLPVKKEIVLISGAETAVSMTLVHHTLIEGQFEITRMTFEEIVAAGIDIHDPANQHIVKINLKLTYSDEVVDQTYCFNMLTGRPLPGLSNFIDTDIGTGGGNHENKEDDEHSPGTTGGIRDNERIYLPVLVNPDQYSAGATVAVLDMPAEASFLKEFFDVRLHIINNASTEFSVTDNIVTLNVPEGLTIMDLLGYESSSEVRIPEIPGQSSETIQWIIRGDEEGDYLLSADYTGTLSQFNEQIQARFEAEDPIKVYGLSAVKLIATINTTMTYDALYFDLAIENIGEADIYMPSIKVTDNILSSFRFLIGEDGNPENVGSRNPEVRHLNTVLSNNLEFSQNIGTEAEVKSLSPGSTMTKKYAVYNATGETNILYLRDAVAEVAQGQNVRFEIIEIAKDLFSTEDLPEKMEDLNKEKKDIYEYILGDQNFYYVRESVERDESVLQRISEGVYSTAKLILNLDAFYNTDETQELTRKLVAQLLIDESMQQAIDLRIDTKYLDVTKKILTGVSSIVSLDQNSAGFSNSDVKQFTTLLSDGAAIRSMAAALRQGGYDNFYERLISFGISSGISAAVNWDALSTELKSTEVVRKAFSDSCKEMGTVVNNVQKVFNAWNTSAEITSSLISIAASYEEATALLNMLIEYTDSGSAIQNELLSIQRSIKNAHEQMGIQFATQLGKLAVNTAANKKVKAIISYFDKTYGLNVGVMYTYAKVVFGAVDFVFDWGGSIENLHTLRVNTDISFALCSAARKHGLSTEDPEKALYTLSALKYLIKMRLIGEQSYVKITKSGDPVAREIALNEINQDLGTKYTSLDEYLENVQLQLLTYRDNIFATNYENVNLTEAPHVSINYQTSATNESFSPQYEYSYDGTNWNNCFGTAIPIVPGTVARWLWVRAKATSENLSGNVRKVMIPARPRLTGDISVLYTGDSYRISGLKSGTYCYAFTNEKELDALPRVFTTRGGPVILPEMEDWTYLAIGTPASETEFASQIRYLVTETCEHDYEQNSIPATCVEDGRVVYTCTVCDFSYEETLAATGHDFCEWSVTRAPTCEVPGEDSRACLNCEYYELRTVDAPGHTEVTDPAVEPSCTGKGLTEGSHCLVCGDVIIEQQKIPELGHAWVVSYADNADGTHTASYICSNDAEHTKTDEPEEHTYVDGECVCRAQNIFAIVQQPVSVTGTIGETVSVTVVATGEGLSYQWYIRNGMGSWSPSSITTATYEVVMNKDRANRQLYCIITDANGNTLKTDVVSMTGQPDEELMILTQPINVEAKLGENYCVEVIAQGDGMKYQWYFKNKGASRWTPSSVKDSTYDDVMTKGRMGREVYCVITDVWGNSVTSDTVTLVGIPSVDLVIVNQPNDSTAKIGEEFCVTVEAQGEGLKYQWYWRSVGAENWNISGERDNTYDALMTRARHNREVYCVITDAWGRSVTTETAAITGTATTTLEIIRQPEDQAVPLGDLFNVTVEAQGDDIRYQWYFRKAGTERWSASSQKDNCYDDVMTEGRHNRELYCVITDAWGNSLTTDTVTLTAVPSIQLEMIAQPENESAKLDEMFCVTVEARGEGLKYQWYWRNVGSGKWNVSGERDNTYDAVMTKARHNREVYCVINDAWGNSMETDVATITAVPSEVLAIITQPTDVSAVMGENYCVTVEAQGDGLTYQWYFRNAGTSVWYKSSVRDNTYDDVMTKSRAGREVYCVITDLWGNTATTETVTLISLENSVMVTAD